MHQDYLRWESHDPAELATFTARSLADLHEAGCTVSSVELSAENGAVEIWFEGSEAALRAYGYDDAEIAALQAREAEEGS